MLIPITDIDALDDPPGLSKTEIIIGKTIFYGSILFVNMLACAFWDAIWQWVST